MPFGFAGNIYLLGAIGQGLGPVLLTPILTRRLSVTDFGEVTFVTATASILGILFSFGLVVQQLVLVIFFHIKINGYILQ